MDSDHYLSILFNIQVISPTATSIAALLVSFFLLYISALLSGAEVALQNMNPFEKNEMVEGSSHQNHLIQSFLSRLEDTLTSISIWNNLLNVSIVILLIYSLNQFISFSSSYTISFIILALVLIFILLLIGEIIPKIYAKNSPLKFLQKVSPLIYLVKKTTKPLSSLIIKINTSLNNPTKRKTNDVSVDELSKALELTSEEFSEEKNMLEGIINLYNKTAVEIMTPRMDIAYIEASANFKDVLSFIVEVEYSRIPVYSGNADNVKGILYIKDLLPYLNQSHDFHWQKLIRPAFFIPESKKIDDLLEEFRSNKNHMAVVIDEYGGTSGIVTMEDILEEIVGEINDEYDDEEELKYIHQEDGSFIFQGKILLTDFFRITDIDPKTFGKLTDEVDSLAGLILEIKGDFPEPSESIPYDIYLFQIVEMDNKRILKIKFQTNDKEEES